MLLMFQNFLSARQNAHRATRFAWDGENNQCEITGGKRGDKTAACACSNAGWSLCKNRCNIQEQLNVKIISYFIIFFLYIYFESEQVRVYCKAPQIERMKHTSASAASAKVPTRAVALPTPCGAPK